MSNTRKYGDGRDTLYRYRRRSRLIECGISLISLLAAFRAGADANFNFFAVVALVAAPVFLLSRATTDLTTEKIKYREGYDDYREP